MKYSGLYFIPNVSTNLDAALSTVNALVQGLETSFRDATRQGSWSLSYRAFRDTLPTGYQPTNDADGKPKPYPHTYQHVLHHTALSPSRTFVCTQQPGKPGTVTSIPVRQQDVYTTLLRQQSNALWASRHILSLPQGTVYVGGPFTIQMGELRYIRDGPQSSTIQSPGVVVCISTVVGDTTCDADNADTGKGALENGAAMDVDREPDVEFEFAQAMIRDCWNKIKEGRDLGRAEVKEVMMAQEDVKGVQERDNIIRMWCHVLRLRG